MPSFSEILIGRNRVAVAGVPRAGKTTLAFSATDRIVVSTDAYLEIDWEDVPGVVIAELGHFDRYVVEGVRVPWLLRAGLSVDAVVWMGNSRVELETRQRALGEASRAVFEEWRMSRGTTVFEL